MTLATTVSRTSYPGTGSTGPFAFPFRIQADSDLRVTTRSALGVETQLVLNVDYTVAGTLNASGTVTLTNALAVGDTVVIRRARSLTQPTSIRNQGPYFAATHEDEFDRLVGQLQDLQDQIDRSVKLSETYDASTYNTKIPPGAVGQVLTWGVSGLTSSTIGSSGSVGLPGGGRSVSSLTSYLLSNAVYNSLDFGDNLPKSANVVAAMNAAGAAGGGHVLMPAGAWTGSDILIPPPGVWLMAHGATYTSTQAGTICRITGGHVRGLKIVGPGGASVGFSLGDTGIVGHHGSIDECEVTGCFDGVVIQLTFYGWIGHVDSFSNLNSGCTIKNTSISNDLTGLSCRGNGIQKYGLIISDATANSEGIRIRGGTFEGNTIQQIDLRGPDDVIIDGPHVEANAPVALTGTLTMTNGSTAVTGAGTAFLSQIVAGQYIKLNADSNPSWARVQSVTNDGALTLSRVYNGTGGAGAAAQVVAGLIRVASGAGLASRNQILNPNMAIASGTCPGIDIENGQFTLIIKSDINLPLLIGASGLSTKVICNAISGGLSDVGSDTQMLGSGTASQFYMKSGLNKVFDLVVGGAQLQLKSTNPLQVPPLLLVAPQGGTGTGISLTNTPAKNLRGQIAVANAATTGAVVFTTAETDAVYFLAVTPVSVTGAPAAGSNRITQIAKTNTGFTITVEVAPGAGTSVTFDWILIR